MKIEFPWHRIALVGELAERLQEAMPLGRTSLMKLLYFLQEARGVDLGYEFSLYNYGPFDAAVLSDLDTAELFSTVDVKVQSYGGYQITPAEGLPRAKGFANEFLEGIEDNVSGIVEEFGNYTAKALELRATVHYVAREISHEEGEVTREEILERVGAVKPEFSPDSVKRAIDDLREKEYLTL